MARRLKSESGRSGSGPVSVSSAIDNDLRIVNAVRDCWLDLQLEPRNWRFMRKSLSGKSLSEGVGEYSQSSFGVTDVASWWHETCDYQPRVCQASSPQSEWSLKWLPYERFASMFLVGQPDNGVPQYWSQGLDGKLLIGPKPDATPYLLRIDYVREPTALTGDTDSPDMPTRFHMFLVWEALKSVAVTDASNENLARAADRAASLYDALCADQAEPITFAHRPLA